MSWSEPRVLLEVLRAGGVTAAAQTLRVAPGTVRRTLAALEARHGEPLLVRGLHGWEPTPAALSLVRIAKRLERLADGPRPNDAAGAVLEGVVRVSAAEVLAVEHLPAALKALCALHPGLIFNIGANDEPEDLLRGGADIVVRTYRPNHRALVARRAGSDRLGLYAHRDYLAAAGVPEHAEDLGRFAVIGPSTDTRALRLLRRAGFPLTRKDFAFRCDSLLGQLVAVEAGLGIGPVLASLAARRPSLVPVLPNIALPREIWVVMHEDQRDSRIVRLVFDALVGFFRFPEPGAA